MKKLIFSLTGLILGIGLYAQASTSISAACTSLIDEFMNCRLELAVVDRSKDLEKAESILYGFIADHESLVSQLSPQEQVIITNFYVNERYALYWDMPEKNDFVRGFLKDQMNVIESWGANIKNNACNKWLLATRADVTSCYMSYTVADVMKYGLALKPMYEEAVKQDPEFCYGLINLGQWYFWAPGISGGSKKKATNCLERAYAAAKTPAEKYYACYFYSQMLFENGKTADAAKILAEAEAILPDSINIKTAKKANKDGLSLFAYQKKNSSLSEEAADKDK